MTPLAGVADLPGERRWTEDAGKRAARERQFDG